MEELLIGWREIAEYFRLRDPDTPHESPKGLSTVRRWYRKGGLPVTFLPMPRGGRWRAVISRRVCDVWLALQSEVFKRWARGPKRRRRPRQLRLPGI